MALRMFRALPSRATRRMGRSLQQMAFSTDDRIATNEEQATGKKREELEAAARGESRFSLTPLRSAFGTYDNPVIVPSGTTSRIVGCQGGVEGGKKYHEVMWMDVKEGTPSMCSLCGQIFKLESDHSQHAH
eukprot:CAMPEP_0195525666 /NCGR_PEP_ID=MMETSP0794_2-20130614/26217_1 /TAXON_ID=515487 /ORGANISM="Stephanopyxis turris, Strain CCMP 815" /LENGTH=130 /DNA_ID=CAMNT_0040656169 /DNA_START=55 /DNA_END=447 /DNA_ORIENTATION=+